MKHLTIKTLLFSSLAFSLTGCLKEATMNVDPETAQSTIALANTGNNLAVAKSQFPGFYSDLGTLKPGESSTFNVNVSYSGAQDAPEDITVNLGLDNDLMAYYNTTNGAHYEAPPTTLYSMPTSAVIKKGTRMVQVPVKVTYTPTFDFSKSYGLPIKITSASKGNISVNWGKAVYSFGLRNIYDGHYSLRLYSLRAGDPAKTGTRNRAEGMDLVTVGGNKVQFGELQVWADNTGVGIGNPILTVNGDNSVDVSSDGGAINAPGYNCRYVPAEKAFYVSFTWGAGPSARLATDTLVYVRPR
ncbi:DUF1735 domain-containing protein [Paraflavitalea sp. CAU 1676]|uniref:DUF1735 domain-containing protein n=1 Tax=Paraflavitalea sp. CAU 1676 TaxID=3032598 RepID=UPI0023DBD062|nr:DUF1735 domain-containing protein [Paraflavitalea sp. CAU 1676]MDF2192249.1 DUF1735 domain-containing protein [Paraflavitalea sp. CAU 1676]